MHRSVPIYSAPSNINALPRFPELPHRPSHNCNDDSKTRSSLEFNDFDNVYNENSDEYDDDMM